MTTNYRTATGGSINTGGRADAKAAPVDAEAKARDDMRERTRHRHKQTTDTDETPPSGKTIENTYAGDLSKVRAEIMMAARTAAQWISDPAEREAAIRRYVWNAERREGGLK